MIQIRSVIAEVEALRIPHLVVEGDCWYSCPASGQCCNNEADAGATACDCGAAEHNARVDRLVAALQCSPTIPAVQRGAATSSGSADGSEGTATGPDGGIP